MNETGDTGVIRLETGGAFIEHATEMLANTRREITVLSSDLEPEWLGASRVCDALRRFAVRNRRSQVRILVTDASSVVKNRHPWLELIRRMSRIDCRVIKAEILDREPMKGSFLLSDRSGIVYRGSEAGYSGFAHYDDRATVSKQLEIFEQYWNYSDASAEFRTLAL